MKSFAKGLGRCRIALYAASCAFFLFLSLVPITILVCSILPLTPLTSDDLLRFMTSYVPESMSTLLNGIVSDVYSTSAATLSISIIATAWSAGKAFSALMRGFEEIYEDPVRDSYILLRLRACAYTIILLLIVVLFLAVMVFGEKLMDMIAAAFPISGSIFDYLVNLRFVIILCPLTVIFALMYKWIPDIKLRFSAQLPGAVFSAVAWVIFSFAFSAYISLTGSFGTFGRLGTIVIAMLSMYYCMYFLLTGAYMNKYISLKKKK